MKNINRGFLLHKYDSINLGLAVLFAWVPLTSLTSSIFGDLYQQTSIFTLLQILYLLSIFNAIPAILRGRIKLSLIAFAFGFAFIYAISSLACSDELLKKQAFRNFYLWCLPYFALSFRVRDYASLFKTLRWPAFIAMVCEILNLLVFSSVSSYSQDIGYDALLPFIVFYLSFYKDRKTLYFVFTLISFALILMSGSRGPLLCAILAFISVNLYNNKINKKTIKYVIIIIGTYLIYSIFQEEILSWLLNKFTDLSVSTRSIEMLWNGDIASDNGRASLRNQSFIYAYEHPIIGSGFLNDRVYLYQFGFITSNTATVYGSYSHFFIAEILMQFGLLTGFVVLWIFFENVLSRILTAKSIDETYIFLIVLSIGLYPLFVSRSWFTFPYFYLILGLLFSESSLLNYARINKKELHI